MGKIVHCMLKYQGSSRQAVSWQIIFQSKEAVEQENFAIASLARGIFGTGSCELRRLQPFNSNGKQLITPVTAGTMSDIMFVDPLTRYADGPSILEV